jgi:hypothetical protein
MKLQICNVAIVYLSLSLFILFMGISRIPKNEVILEILLILFITFLLNMLCINGLNKVAWYLVIFFILIPFLLAVMSVLPLFVAMLRSTIFKSNKNIILFLLFLLGLSVFIVFNILYFSWIAEGKKHIYITLLFSSMIVLLIFIFIGSLYFVLNTK